jgi:hypothetical protein
MTTSFDAESYRKEAIEAGIPESIIKQTIAEHGQANVATKPTQADVQIGNGYEFLEPAAYTLAGTAAVSQAPSIYKSIKDRFMAPSQTAAPIEPMMDVSQRPVGRQEPRMVGDLFPADVSTKPTFGPTPENPTVDLKTKINNKPNNFNLVEESEQNKLKNDLANTKKQAETEGAPQGWRNQYNKNTKKNPNGPNPLGPGAFNYVASNVEQKGVETPELARKIWEEQYGTKNVSYDQMMKDWSAAKRPEKPASIGVKPGGSGGTPKFIPEYIKGNASLGGMGSLALMATALGLAGSEKGQAAMAKAANAIKDIGFSPDILTNKAEEMGRLGTGYVTAGNPVYRRELEQKLQSTNDPQYKKVLQEELAKMSSSSNSPYRSVPPSR